MPKKKISKNKLFAVSAGIAAAGAGAYYFLGPKGKQHRKKAKVVAAKLERGAKRGVKKVQAAAKKYQSYEKEVRSVVSKLKTSGRKAVRTGKRVSRRASKKRA